ncbi:TraM recognition domain-containing protein [Streptacidiphilus sp. P02-A3a]|uniref:TraM recognition domain-containing protein n=1 Tax=Streptacidiphilus sp. P02-A3a TaxID=2704468 RepID=UPI0015FD5025|nr:TraM recognition domain-containing protein [Streptacidiphilus sp. P02-A3a]QMU73160.1 TraM recognition domain-containing protein [Streptacidiphilus sp. P02-A3a]
MMARQAPDPRAPGPRPWGPQPSPARGIPDGAIVGVLAILLGTTTLVWTATALAGLITHGRLPHPLPFEGTPTAIRVLATEPNQLSAAWPGTPVAALPSATAFWTTFFVLLALLIALALTMLSAWTRLRRAAAAARTPQPDQDGPPFPGPVPTPVPQAQAPQPHAPQPQPGAQRFPPPRRTPPQAGPPSATEITTEIPPQLSAQFSDQFSDQFADPLPAAWSEPLRGPLPSGAPVRPAAAAKRAFAFPPGAVCLLAPDPGASAAAKRRLLQDAVSRATGAVLVVSDDLGLWRARPAHRDARLFDPLRLTDADSDARVRWAPHSRCEDPAVAGSRARALLAATGRPGNSPGEKSVQEAAQALLRCWLHAAALDGRPFRHVLRWAAGTARQEAVTVLRTADPHLAAPGWSGELQSILGNATELREAALDRVLSALDALSELHVLKACTPESATDALDVESFLRNRGTLYLTGRADEARVSRSAHSAMPLLTALVDDVVEHGRRIAVRSSSGRLDPPLLCVLDNVASVSPLPGLPELMSRGGPLGLDTVAVLRSPEQARARWGDRAVHSLWTSADARIVLGPSDGPLPEGPATDQEPAENADLDVGELLLLRHRHPAERVTLPPTAASSTPTAASG